MNEARVRAIPEFNGWRAEFRKLDRSGWHPVEIGGVAQLYDSEERATIAAYEAQTTYHFGKGILRDGEKAGVAKAGAEFDKIFPRRGQKPVIVERR